MSEKEYTKPSVNEKSIENLVNLLSTHGPITIERLSRKLLVSKGWATKLCTKAADLGMIKIKIFKTPTYRVGIRVCALNDASDQMMISSIEESSNRWQMGRGMTWG